MRGRPAGEMTHRQWDVFSELCRQALAGESVPIREVARRCNMDNTTLRRLLGRTASRELKPPRKAI